MGDMVTGGQLVARMLKKEGVRHIFTLSGLHVAPIYAGCVEEGIQVIDTRHEQAAAHAADAYARVTRGVGVAVVTAGPGRDRRAHRRGQRLRGQLADDPPGRRGAHLQPEPRLAAGDGAGGPLPPHHQVVGPRPHAGAGARLPGQGLPGGALRAAGAGVPGAGLGRALQRARTRPALQLPASYRTDARAGAGSAQGGRGAWRCSSPPSAPPSSPARRCTGTGPWDALRRFCETAQMPVYLNGAGRGCLPASHPLFFQHTRKEALSGADVVFVIGTPVRLPAQLRRRAHLQRRVEDRPGGHRPDRDRAQPRGGRGHHRATATARSTAFADAAPRAKRDAFLAQLRGREQKKLQATSRQWTRTTACPSTTTGWPRRCRTWPTRRGRIRCSSRTAATGWPWRPR